MHHARLLLFRGTTQSSYIVSHALFLHILPRLIPFPLACCPARPDPLAPVPTETMRCTPRADTQRRAPCSVHRPHRGQEWENEVHRRERDKDAHCACGHAYLHPRLLCEHQGGSRCHLLADFGQPCGQGVHKTQERVREDGRGVMTRDENDDDDASLMTRLWLSCLCK